MTWARLLLLLLLLAQLCQCHRAALQLLPCPHPQQQGVVMEVATAGPLTTGC
jgi:hypothetical protein